jgi:hypothetical protein
VIAGLLTKARWPKPAGFCVALFDATLGEFYRRAGDPGRARQHFEAARQKTKSPFDRELLDRRQPLCV